MFLTQPVYRTESQGFRPICFTILSLSHHFVVFHRNIFFRVTNLRRLGVKLVFVIEGKAPKLKYDEMNRRTQARGVGGGAGRGGRSNFDVKLREVVLLLENVITPHKYS